MGNWNSGRRRRSARKCESCYRIELPYLRRNGFLTPGAQETLSWSRRGEQSGSIQIGVMTDGLRLDYSIQQHGGDWQPAAEHIPFAYTPKHFGGKQLWLLCPGCHGRAAVLYGGPRFRCRKCQRLTYQSQYEPGWERARTKAAGVRKKLGGSGHVAAIDQLFPPKPKGMHWRTYNRLCAGDEEMKNAFYRGFKSSCARLMAWA
ncbi:MAG: hypothetical protein WCD20_02620 [Rhodomicrobium sp.]